MTSPYADGSAATMEGGYTAEEIEESVDERGSDNWWLQRSRHAYSSSEDWFDSSVRVNPVVAPAKSINICLVISAVF